MPYCFEFTFTFILANKKIEKVGRGCGGGKKTRKMISQDSFWVLLLPQEASEHQGMTGTEKYVTSGQGPTSVSSGAGLMQNPGLLPQALRLLQQV